MSPVELNQGLWSYRGDAIHSRDPSGEGGCYVEGLDTNFDNLEDAVAAIDLQHEMAAHPDWTPEQWRQFRLGLQILDRDKAILAALADK